MMTMINLKIFKRLIIVNIIITIVVLVFWDIEILYNAQIGFLSSSIIMFASMKSYSKMVSHRLANEIITTDIDKDIIDIAEDPYDLYSEDKIEDDDEKRPISQSIKDASSALSFYRISSYILLVIGFLYLNRHHLLNIPTYLIAISIPLLVVVFTLIGENKDISEI